ncbi:MAG: hypothetical protein V4501_04725 [Pseudomonadota bacterium]
MRNVELKLLTTALLSILFSNTYAAPAASVVTTQTTTLPAGTPAPVVAAPAPAPTSAPTPTPAPAAVNADGSIPMAAPTAPTTGPAPEVVTEPEMIKPSSNHGYVLAQGTINQPYGSNPYRTLSVTVSPCDAGYSPHVAMAIGGIAGWNSHTVAEAWAVPTSAIRRDGSTYSVNYRAESRFYNGNWAWSSNVYVTWTLYCIPTDSFTYTPH